jgi:hypothetical protein
MEDCMQKLMMTLAATTLLAFATPAAFAQELMVNGNPVPQGQQAEVQDWCSELQAQQGTTGTQEPETTMTEQPAEAASSAAVDGEIDVKAITLEMCQEAGLVDKLGQ